MHNKRIYMNANEVQQYKICEATDCIQENIDVQGRYVFP